MALMYHSLCLHNGDDHDEDDDNTTIVTWQTLSALHRYVADVVLLVAGVSAAISSASI